MKLSNIVQWLASIGFDGVYRPSDDQLVAPVIQIPLTLNNTGTTQIISGAAPAALWADDSNLNTFMPQTGRFFLVGKAYQFTVAHSPTLDPVEESAIAEILRGLTLRHSPLVGAKAYDYRALPGAVFDTTITAVATTDAATNRVAAQSPFQLGTPQAMADDLAIDIANDVLEVVFPVVGGAPATFAARLDIYGFALSYDGRPAIERLIREGGPDAYLKGKSDKKNLPRLLAARLVGPVTR